MLSDIRTTLRSWSNSYQHFYKDIDAKNKLVNIALDSTRQSGFIIRVGHKRKT